MCCRRSGFLFIGPPNNSVKDHKADRTFQRSVVHTLPFQIDYLLLSRTQEAHKETKHNVGDIIMTWTISHVICIEPTLWSKRNPFQLILLGICHSNGSQTARIPGEECESKTLLWQRLPGRASYPPSSSSSLASIMDGSETPANKVRGRAWANQRERGVKTWCGAHFLPQLHGKARVLVSSMLY